MKHIPVHVAAGDFGKHIVLRLLQQSQMSQIISGSSVH